MASVNPLLNGMTSDKTVRDYKHASKTFVDNNYEFCLLYTSPSPRDYGTSRMPSSA